MRQNTVPLSLKAHRRPISQPTARALLEVLQVIDAAPRKHPEREGATFWSYNLIPRTIERMRAVISAAECELAGEEAEK